MKEVGGGRYFLEVLKKALQEIFKEGRVEEWFDVAHRDHVISLAVKEIAEVDYEKTVLIIRSACPDEVLYNQFKWIASKIEIHLFRANVLHEITKLVDVLKGMEPTFEITINKRF